MYVFMQNLQKLSLSIIKYSLLSTALENPWMLVLSSTVYHSAYRSNVKFPAFIRNCIYSTIKQAFLLPTMTPNILISHEIVL